MAKLTGENKWILAAVIMKRLASDVHMTAAMELRAECSTARKRAVWINVEQHQVGCDLRSNTEASCVLSYCNGIVFSEAFASDCDSALKDIEPCVVAFSVWQ